MYGDKLAASHFMTALGLTVDADYTNADLAFLIARHYQLARRAQTHGY